MRAHCDQPPNTEKDFKIFTSICFRGPQTQPCVKMTEASRRAENHLPSQICSKFLFISGSISRSYVEFWFPLLHWFPKWPCSTHFDLYLKMVLNISIFFFSINYLILYLSTMAAFSLQNKKNCPIYHIPFKLLKREQNFGHKNIKEKSLGFWFKITPLNHITL